MIKHLLKCVGVNGKAHFLKNFAKGKMNFAPHHQENCPACLYCLSAI